VVNVELSATEIEIERWQLVTHTLQGLRSTSWSGLPN
jgi:hypothetical protein